MSLGDRVHHHKAKLNNDINNYTLRPMQKPGTPEYHKSMTSQFNVINKYDQRKPKKGNIYYLSNKYILWLYRYTKFNLIHVIS